MSRLTALKPGTRHRVGCRDPRPHNQRPNSFADCGYTLGGGVEGWEGTFLRVEHGRWDVYVFDIDGEGEMAFRRSDIMALDGRSPEGMSDLDEARHLLWQITGQCAPRMDAEDTRLLIEKLEQAVHDLKVVELVEMSVWEDSDDHKVLVGGVDNDDPSQATVVWVVDYPRPSGTTGAPWTVPIAEFYKSHTRVLDP